MSEHNSKSPIPNSQFKTEGLPSHDEEVKAEFYLSEDGEWIPDGWDDSSIDSLLIFSNGKSSPTRHEGGTYEVFGSNGSLGFSNQTNASDDTIVIGRVGSYCGSLYYPKKKIWVTDNAIKARTQKRMQILSSVFTNLKHYN